MKETESLCLHLYYYLRKRVKKRKNNYSYFRRTYSYSGDRNLCYSHSYYRCTYSYFL